jgi:hypothetical protein
MKAVSKIEAYGVKVVLFSGTRKRKVFSGANSR